MVYNITARIQNNKSITAVKIDVANYENWPKYCFIVNYIKKGPFGPIFHFFDVIPH